LARRATAALGPVQLVTTDEVLAEFLTALSGGGPAVRSAAAAVVRQLLTSGQVRVVPQSRDSFLQAVSRYAARLDKSYSHADCSSMNAMDAAGIRDVLTMDHHFAQEGYNVLVPSNRGDEP
jgi:predicted nucleic acid-binding protein